VQVNRKVVNLHGVARPTGSKHEDHHVFAPSCRRPSERADFEVFDFVGEFTHRRQRDFGNDVTDEVLSRSGCRWTGPELKHPRSFMGGRVEEREHRVEMDGVTVKPVTMRAGEPGQLAGGSLNWVVFQRRCFHRLSKYLHYSC